MKMPIEITEQINTLENRCSSEYPIPISVSQESERVSTATYEYDYPAMIGLRLGRQKEVRDSFASSVPTPAKRSRASYQNMQNPCCQVEGCNLDLKSAKDYHRRHRICESHSKSPKVIVAGMERRFCQQCSRFHDLSEFDDKKRSCRRRLSDHNARRRRVQPDSVQLSSAGLSSALYVQRQMNLPLNGLPISISNSTWDNAKTSMFRQGLVRPSWSGGLDCPPCFPSDEIHKSIFELHMDLDKLSSIPTANHRVLDQCLQIPTNNSPIVTDMLNAHSLLSSNSWGLNEGEDESTSVHGHVHGSYIDPALMRKSSYIDPALMRKSSSEPHNLSLVRTFNIPVEQGPAVAMVGADNGGTSHQQEYQLFRAPYDSTSGFSSIQRNL